MMNLVLHMRLVLALYLATVVNLRTLVKVFGLIVVEASTILIECITIHSISAFLFHIGQVIMVGHDFGGFSISYAMGLFPLKISKAVFIAAPM